MFRLLMFYALLNQELYWLRIPSFVCACVYVTLSNS